MSYQLKLMVRVFGFARSTEDTWSASARTFDVDPPTRY